MMKNLDRQITTFQETGELYLEYGLSLRDLVEICTALGIDLDDTWFHVNMNGAELRLNPKERNHE